MAETVTVTKPAPILEGSLTAFLSQIDKLGGGALDPRFCLLYTSPSPRDLSTSRMPSSA